MTNHNTTAIIGCWIGILPEGPTYFKSRTEALAAGARDLTPAALRREDYDKAFGS